ncbi:MAG: GNAT family N-acetyltransferase [Longibaculum sp.]
MIEIKKGYSYIDEIKELILKYYQELDRNLDFQNIDEELNHLQEKYQEPNGELLVALMNQKVVGCVAYHQFQDEICEMKRLYVLPEYRAYHIGQLLVEEIIKEAKLAGYKDMVLDTIEPLQSAIHLYKKMGFEEVDAYYNNPMKDVIYMKLHLSKEKTSD